MCARCRLTSSSHRTCHRESNHDHRLHYLFVLFELKAECHNEVSRQITHTYTQHTAHICTYAHMHTYTHAHICTRTHTHTYAQKYTHTRICAHTYTHTRVRHNTHTHNTHIHAHHKDTHTHYTHTHITRTDTHTNTHAHTCVSILEHWPVRALELRNTDSSVPASLVGTNERGYDHAYVYISTYIYMYIYIYMCVCTV